MLPKGLKQDFWNDLKAYEEERHMPYITSVEEIGFERGLREGEERGLRAAEERSRSLILRQLTRKVGILPEKVTKKIETSSLSRLESLGEALLDFSSLADLENWLKI
jgi:predicted transposase YdaD